MRIDAQVFGFDEVPGNMEILDSLFRHGEHELVRVIFVVDTVDDDIVDIEKQVAVGFTKHRVREFDFRH